MIIPDSVTSIGTYAFYCCYGLERLTIGSGVESIGTRAIYACVNLSSVFYNGEAEDWALVEKDALDFEGVIVKFGTEDLFGDVTGDGKVTSLDAAYILRYDAGTSNVDIDLFLADVSGDGKVTSLDAAYILRLDAGLIDELPVETAKE